MRASSKSKVSPSEVEKNGDNLIRMNTSSLVLSAIAVAIVVGTGAFSFVWIPLRLSPHVRLYHVDTSLNQTIGPTISSQNGFTVSRIGHVLYRIPHTLSLSLFPVIMFFWYADIQKGRTKMLVKVFGIALPFFTLLIARLFLTKALWITFIPSAAMAIALIVSSPKGSRIPLYFLLHQFMLLSACVSGMLLVPILPTTTSLIGLVLWMAFMILWKEAIYIAMKFFGYYLEFDADINGGSSVNRSAILCLQASGQMWCTLMKRFWISSYCVDITSILVVTLSQVAEESFVRLTRNLRHKYFQKALKKIFPFLRAETSDPNGNMRISISKNAIVELILVQNSKKDLSDFSLTEKLSQAKRLSIGNFLIVEMISEYYAIFTFAAFILVFESVKVCFSVNFFLNQPSPFDQNLNFVNFFLFIFIQLLGEMVTDYICCAYEERYGYPLAVAMYELKSKCKEKLCSPLIIGLIFAATYTNCAVEFFLTLNSGNCPNENDMCCCWEDYKPQSMRPLYCERIYGEEYGYGSSLNYSRFKQDICL